MALQSIQHLVTDQITAEDILKAFPRDATVTAPEEGGRICAFGRKSEMMITEWVAQQKKLRRHGSTAAATTGTITARQVDFILSLIEDDRHLGCWYSGPTTAEGVQAMSKESASAYISAMLDS